MDACLSKICRDKEGEEFTLQSCSGRSCADILPMYEQGFPQPVSQGLPPEDPTSRRAWLEGILAQGEGYMAVHQGKVVGHAVLIVDRARNDAEFLIFVTPAFQNRGLGSHLLKRALERARELKLGSLWLMVEAFNFRAIGLYKKFGFKFRGPLEGERTMLLEL